MKIEKIKQHLISAVIAVFIIGAPIYLEHFYAPKFSSYDNESFRRIVDKSDYVIQYINNNIDSPTIENMKTVKKEVRKILDNESQLRNNQTIINKIIKNEYTLTQSQAEILKDKHDRVFRLEERFTVAILEKVFHLKDFSTILEAAKSNNYYQSTGIKIKYIDQRYDIALQGSSISFLERSTQSGEESLDSIVSRRYFLIDTPEQKYYLRVPTEYEMSTGEDSLILDSDSLRFNLVGKVSVDIRD